MQFLATIAQQQFPFSEFESNGTVEHQGEPLGVSPRCHPANSDESQHLFVQRVRDVVANVHPQQDGYTPLLRPKWLPNLQQYPNLKDLSYHDLPKRPILLQAMAQYLLLF